MSRAIFRYAPPSRVIRIGEILAQKYRVERMIGRGGMGLVVLATHVHLKERVALKVLLPGSPVTPEAFRRLVREGRAAARLRGEHVARVLDAGVLDSGEPYYVMEHLTGSDLRSLVRARGPFPVETAARYVVEACEALAEAHSLGIVHRDLKPANLFEARRPDGSTMVKVIDFGVSKVVGGEEGQSSLTAQGGIGTPAFMAPEQMRSAREVDARSDIWSLGAVLFALLTGEPPFAGDTMIEVYESIQRGAPPLRGLRPDAPPELEQVVSRCLSVDPDDRFASAADLAVAVAAVLPAELRGSAERACRFHASQAGAGADVAGEDGARETPGHGEEDTVLQHVGSFAGPGGSGAEGTASFIEPSWRETPAARASAPVGRSNRLRWALGVSALTAVALVLGLWRWARVSPPDTEEVPGAPAIVGVQAREGGPSHEPLGQVEAPPMALGARPGGATAKGSPGPAQVRSTASPALTASARNVPELSRTPD